MKEKLSEWYRLAEAGDATSQYNLGHFYLVVKPADDHHDLREAAKWFRLGAAQGHADAQRYLGFLYEIGFCVDESGTEAAKWYRLAADQGNAGARFNLGVLYANGQGVVQDYTEAVKWYRLAAEQGEAMAQFSLGLLYANGYGVNQDYVEAAKWFRLAADQGHPDAQKVLIEISNQSWTGTLH